MFLDFENSLAFRLTQPKHLFGEKWPILPGGAALVDGRIAGQLAQSGAPPPLYEVNSHSLLTCGTSWLTLTLDWKTLLGKLELDQNTRTGASWSANLQGSAG